MPLCVFRSIGRAKNSAFWISLFLLAARGRCGFGQHKLLPSILAISGAISVAYRSAEFSLYIICLHVIMLQSCFRYLVREVVCVVQSATADQLSESEQHNTDVMDMS
jgi:hypothetical protein